MLTYSHSKKGENMEYEYEMGVFGPVDMIPKETKKGKIALAFRPKKGEEVCVDGQWHEVLKIRHTATGILLVLTGLYTN